MGNFLHCGMVAIALVKEFANLPRSPGILTVVFLYVVLAVGFGLVLFRHPKTD